MSDMSEFGFHIPDDVSEEAWVAAFDALMVAREAVARAIMAHAPSRESSGELVAGTEWQDKLLTALNRRLLVDGDDDRVLHRVDVAAALIEAGATPSRESSDELATLAAKYLGMDVVTFRDSTGFAEGYGPECEAILADIKRLAGSVVSQARGDK